METEQRAHDLAILSTKNLFELKKEDNDIYNKNHPYAQKDLEFDTYGEYIKTYDAYIKRLSSHTYGTPN